MGSEITEEQATVYYTPLNVSVKQTKKTKRLAVFSSIYPKLLTKCGIKESSIKVSIILLIAQFLRGLVSLRYYSWFI